MSPKPENLRTTKARRCPKPEFKARGYRTGYFSLQKCDILASNQFSSSPYFSIFCTFEGNPIKKERQSLFPSFWTKSFGSVKYYELFPHNFLWKSWARSPKLKAWARSGLLGPLSPMPETWNPMKPEARKNWARPSPRLHSKTYLNSASFDILFSFVSKFS